MKIRIKGCLWKAGVNGLGVMGFHRLPYRERFNFAARRHDEDYDLGGYSWDRRMADINFLWRMLAASESDIQVAVAVAYYWVVRLLGWLFFRYSRTRPYFSRHNK